MVQAGFLLLIAVFFSSSARASESSAVFSGSEQASVSVRAGYRIQDLVVDAESSDLVELPSGTRMIVLKGSYRRPNWSLVVNSTQPIRPRADGSFETPIQVDVHTRYLVLTAVGPLGEVEKAVLDLRYGRSETVQHGWSFRPGIGVMGISWQQTSQENPFGTPLTTTVAHSSTMLTPRVELRYGGLFSHTTFEMDAWITAVALRSETDLTDPTGTSSSTSAPHFWRAGARLERTMGGAPWTLGFSFGVTTGGALGSTSELGVQSQSGPELGASLAYSFRGGELIRAYGRWVGVESGAFKFRLADRLWIYGLNWSTEQVSRHPVSIRLEGESLSVSSTDSTAKSTSVALLFSYGL